MRNAADSHQKRPGALVLKARLALNGDEVIKDHVFLARDPVWEDRDPLWDADYTTLDKVRDHFQAVQWAWPKWIPAGHLTMLVGAQGVGKSYFAAYLLAALGGYAPIWPDGTPVTGDQRPVVLIDTEEFRGEYAQRLMALGVPMGQVLLPGKDPTYLPSIPSDAYRVAALAHGAGCGGVIIDSLSGSHRIDENSASMRDILQSLVKLAGVLNVPVVLVHHTRKRGMLEGKELTLDKVRGSNTITQFCRSVIALQRLHDEDDTAPVRVQSIKNSFSRKPEPLGFLITDQGLSFCEAPEHGEAWSVTHQAAEFIQAALCDGPKSSAALLQQAAALGISRGTLYRARDLAGVVSVGKGQWALKSSQPPGHETLEK
jgi:hypothetical protein